LPTATSFGGHGRSFLNIPCVVVIAYPVSVFEMRNARSARRPKRTYFLATIPQYIPDLQWLQVGPTAAAQPDHGVDPEVLHGVVVAGGEAVSRVRAQHRLQ
jgi:hypothetical protein